MRDLERSSPGNLTRAGRTRNSLEPDDRVEVVLYLLRHGHRGGAWLKVTLLASGPTPDCLAGANIRLNEKPNPQ